MEITMLQTESPAGGLIEFSGTLRADEASELARGAYLRIAAALGTDEAEARQRARFMLTDNELRVLTEETVKARAADRAIGKLGLAFLLAPSIQSSAPYEEGSPYAFHASAHAVPALDIDLETPVGHADPAVDRAAGPLDATAEARYAQKPAAAEPRTELEEFVLRSLRARLTGTVPASLESAAVACEHDTFRKNLHDSGETYREYRIRTGKNPHTVEKELHRRAMRRLFDDIVLETIYRTQSLTVTPEDESRVLSAMAPGREEGLRAELDNAGKLWMLAQKTRRAKALDWAIAHLLA